MIDHLHIRLAQAQDLRSIIDIYNSTIPTRQSTADLTPVTIEQKQHWFNTHLNDKQRPIYVVEHNQHIIAWGSFSDYSPRAAYRISSEISIYVHPNHRQQKIGQQLLHYMTQQAPKLGIQNIIAVVFGHNTPSLKLFYNNHYEQWGKLPQVCQLDEQLADIIILGKRLPETNHNKIS